MTSINKTIGKFHFGETVEVLFDFKDRDGTSLSNPDSQTVTIKFAATETGASILTLNASPQVTQPTSGIATYYLRMQLSDYTGILAENTGYWYNAFSTYSTDDPILQAHGKFKLEAAI